MEEQSQYNIDIEMIEPKEEIAEDLDLTDENCEDNKNFIDVMIKLEKLPDPLQQSEEEGSNEHTLKPIKTELTLSKEINEIRKEAFRDTSVKDEFTPRTETKMPSKSEEEYSCHDHDTYSDEDCALPPKPPQKAHRCRICGYRTQRRCDLTNHMRTHTGENMFCCDICSMSFARKSNLNMHMRTHTGEKPFSCDLCPKKFIRKSHLNDHMRMHSGVKPYFCGLCEARFARKQTLTTHMWTHTGEKPYSCELCQKKFTQIGHLNLHMTSHTGEKPFPCRLCSVGFIQKNNLIVHMRSHTGEKPFACSLCHAKFVCKNHLTNHMKTHPNAPLKFI